MEQIPSWEANLFHLAKKFPAFNGTWKFITAFTSARQLSLYWARSIQSMPFHPTSWRSILILSSPYAWVFHVVTAPHVSPPKPCIHLSSPLYMPHFPTIIGEEYRPLRSSSRSFRHSTVRSFLLGPYILFSTLFSNTFGLKSSLNVSVQVSHRLKQKAKLYFCIS